MTGRWRQKFRERDAMRARLRLVMRQPNTMNAFLQTASNHISRRMFCAARTLCVSFEMRRALLCAMGLITAAAVQDIVLKADETHARYFEQLRSRSLFSLAEGYAIFRLSQSNLSPSLQTELTVELSRTLAEHACFLPEDQQQEFWRRARATVDDRRTKDETSPEVPLLAIQSAMVTVCEVEWLKIECELQPLNEQQKSRTQAACATAIQQLQESEGLLGSSPRLNSNTLGRTQGRPSSYEIGAQLHRVRFHVALMLRVRAELFPAMTRDRQSDVIEAERLLRKLISVADEPLRSLAKIHLAACSRLAGSLERAQQMLTDVDKTNPQASDEVRDTLVEEQVRLLLSRDRGPDAVELIVKTRSQRKSLSGALWYLQIQSLRAIREKTLEQLDDTLSSEISENAEITLQRCEDQVGGFWSRRCRELWRSIIAADKLGPELDTLLQIARSEFLSGRIESALEKYAHAEKMATASNHIDLAMDSGYTKSSILLQSKRYQSAAEEFLRLSDEYPTHSRAPAAHLNGVYSLGRLYQEANSDDRRVAYSRAIDRHIELYASDVTIDDARFFKAILEEQQSRFSSAVSHYRQIAKGHARSDEAYCGAARCFEAMLKGLRADNKNTTQLMRDAVETLSPFLKTAEKYEVEWTAPVAEVALQLSSFLLQTEPLQLEQTQAWIDSAMARAKRVSHEDPELERWKRIGQWALVLRVVWLSESGQTIASEQQLKSLDAATPRDLLNVVEQFAPYLESTDRQRRRRFADLQSWVAERLNQQRNLLTATDQQSVDQYLGFAALASEQPLKALAVLKPLSEQSPTNVRLQTQIGSAVEAFDDFECLTFSKQCWRRAERSTKPGSVEWLSARLGVLRVTINLQQLDEARKLYDVTQLLYPDLGNPELRLQFLELQRQLKSGGAPSGTRD
jgi:tetratricopeptide (TPR) repeat protein